MIKKRSRNKSTDFIKAAFHFVYAITSRMGIHGHNEGDGNLLQVLKLQIEDCDDLNRWMEEKDYLSPSILNEEIFLMGNT